MESDICCEVNQLHNEFRVSKWEENRGKDKKQAQLLSLPKYLSAGDTFKHKENS
jgi:hypothetical protein